MKRNTRLALGLISFESSSQPGDCCAGSDRARRGLGIPWKGAGLQAPAANQPGRKQLQRDQEAQPNTDGLQQAGSLHTRLPELVGILLHIFPCICTQLILELSGLALGAEE